MKKKSFKNFLAEKNERDLITEENLYDFVIKKEYKYNQEKVFWTVFVSYMVFYLTRKQWTIFGTILMTDGVLSSTQFATVGLVFAISYGIAKFVSSPLSDTKSNKWLLGIGLIGAGGLNLLLGLSWLNASMILTPIILSCVIQVAIGFIHSLGATPSVRFFYNWFPNKQRRTRIISWNVAHNIGSALATFLILGSQTLFSKYLNGSYMGYFLLPSIISILMGIFLIFFIKDRPETVGLPPLKDYYKMELIGAKREKTQEDINEDNKKWGYFFVKYVLKNKYVWLLFISNLCIYTLRMALSDWSLDYLINEKHFDKQSSAAFLYSMFDWGGLLFTLVIGLTANKYLKRFAPITFIVILIATGSLLGFWLLANDNEALIIVFLLIAGVIFIPQCFLPIMVAEVSHWRVVSTAGGLLGIAGYAGDAIMSKIIVGMGLMHLGYNWVFGFVAISGFVAALVLIPLFKVKLSQ
ncbi:MFS transporter [Spiroplasma floricola]|uniref:MFS transporter, OPA family, glycerol-3-phosphate transporter n=1 Tax=Spiroplasma floricola 23-6 TaxID=1336749 RepID=A0A2K8SFX0_9MOLU|nr:MFS transporter [Spiroplasma floricola]AUB31720.1 MFS transporter, OPA family, glycerol-3-phosphate transporter [Spiroplasma floricola 23-6]